MSRLARHIDSRYIRATQTLRRVRRNEHVTLVYVEGYDDIAFWRNIFNQYERPGLRFEISVPSRNDLAKGKKVLLSLLSNCGPYMIVCVDSDFDYLFQGKTSQSKLVNESPYIFQTYTYSIENYTCYPKSLRSVCVKATKNDSFIFDFEEFMTRFSEIVYPVFLWYAFSALNRQETAFTLNDFRNTVKLNFLVLENNGADTLDWLSRNIDRKVRHLREQNPNWDEKVEEFGQSLEPLGVTPQNVYFFMHGHTLQEYVVAVIVNEVCNALKEEMLSMIKHSSREGIPLANELSYYKNSVRDVKFLLEENTEYWNTDLFKRVDSDIRRFVDSIESLTSVPDPK